MINTKPLRFAVGLLGMLLPIIVLVLSCIGGFGWPSSISITFFYYPCVAPFMIILGMAGILLMCYKGYEKIDDVINTITGILGVGVCLFPTYPPSAYLQIYDRVGAFMLTPSLSSMLHNICAIGFFGLLSFNSMFLFTKTSGEMTKQKRIRNIIYRVCAIAMFISVLLCFLLPMKNSIWIGEAAALFFFGISWLTKADCIPFLFADKK